MNGAMSGSGNPLEIPTEPNNLLPIDKRIEELERLKAKAFKNAQTLIGPVSADDENKQLGIVFLELAAKHQSDIIQLERIVEDRNRADASNRQAAAQNKLSGWIAYVAVFASLMQVFYAAITLKLEYFSN